MNALKRNEREVSEDSDNDEPTQTPFFTANDINTAFEKGDTAYAKEIIEELINSKSSEGMSEKEAKASLRSSMTAYWKPLYKEAYKNNDRSEMQRIRYILRDSGLYGRPSEVSNTVRAWIREK